MIDAALISSSSASSCDHCADKLLFSLSRVRPALRPLSAVLRPSSSRLTASTPASDASVFPMADCMRSTACSSAGTLSDRSTVATPQEMVSERILAPSGATGDRPVGVSLSSSSSTCSSTRFSAVDVTVRVTAARSRPSAVG